MSISRDDAERTGRAVASAIREHWGLFLAEGIILVILGLIAMAVPPIATLAFTIIIGWIFLASCWVWMFVSGIVDLILAGIIFAGQPATAAWALGLLVGIDMVFGGAALSAMALASRDSPLGRTELLALRAPVPQGRA
jgi:uncharacterized membrane protein HdeD (DUF308 family)